MIDLVALAGAALLLLALMAMVVWWADHHRGE